jgi:hypothetical protein
MYFHRLRDCLAEDFPALLASLGGARVHNLVTDYLLAHPSSHFSLRELGRALPRFLGGHPLGRERPALADLARLEWARVDVFDEADGAPLSREGLLELGAEDPEEARLSLIPAVRLLRLDASVLPLWKRLDAGENAGEEAASAAAPRGETSAVRVWRKGFAIFHRSMPPDEERCLQTLVRGGASLAALGQRLVGAELPGASEEELARRFAALLDLWTEDQILTGEIQQGQGISPTSKEK